MSIKIKLTISYILLITMIIIFFGVISTLTLEKYYIDNIIEILTSQGTSFSRVFDSYIDADIYTISQDVVKKLATDTNAQVQVLNMEGMLLGDSTLSSTPVPVKILTPDVIQAISGGSGVYTEKINNERVLHVSVPVKNKLNYVAILRLSSSLEEVSNIIKRLVLFLALVLTVSSLVALIIGFFIANELTKPLEMVKKATQEMAKGNFKVRAEKTSNDEIGILADSFNKMAEELGQLEEMKNEFISNISHELKTPLTSIKGFAITAMDLVEKNSELYEYLNIIDEETDRLSRLVDELLDFSKIELNKIKLSFEEVELDKLIEDTVAILRPHASNYGVNLICKKKIDRVVINGDVNRLKQVLVNIIDNGIKACSRGKYVKVFLDIKDKKAVIRIEDQGQGIPQEEIKYIFDKFYRGKNNKYSGTGLGLAISKKIIEEHKGTITVESEVGKGSVFTIELPLKDR
ncbi:Signal transduction histidine kinase [Thermoanaerobacter thermohydrosulfuricus WC1]|uniref:histidine kinase n=1 Tax=Thermoanaerobacter thermohydrosulfuricus WC1 TaxID=1198630 RepID=M8DIF4_THETY|nr:HAMP domain-containing sensor histidine kinase [Thermoanaerobacter thermohydrosulfuricus]EMT39837.1 Signal transduction histidine kinase [Thermoanaerobacter thermohydrosulfuricus WC1]